jgi:hypothetical protein
MMSGTDKHDEAVMINLTLLKRIKKLTNEQRITRYSRYYTYKVILFVETLDNHKLFSKLLILLIYTRITRNKSFCTLEKREEENANKQ